MSEGLFGIAEILVALFQTRAHNINDIDTMNEWEGWNGQN